MDAFRFDPRPSRFHFRPSRFHLRPSRFHFRPFRFPLRPSRLHFRPSRLHFRPSRFHFSPSRFHLRPSRLHFRPSRFHFRPFRFHFRPSRLHFRPSREPTTGSETLLRGRGGRFPDRDANRRPGRAEKESKNIRARAQVAPGDARKPLRAGHGCPARGSYAAMAAKDRHMRGRKFLSLAGAAARSRRAPSHTGGAPRAAAYKIGSGS